MIVLFASASKSTEACAQSSGLTSTLSFATLCICCLWDPAGDFVASCLTVSGTLRPYEGIVLWHSALVLLGMDDQEHERTNGSLQYDIHRRLAPISIVLGQWQLEELVVDLPEGLRQLIEVASYLTLASNRPQDCQVRRWPL